MPGVGVGVGVGGCVVWQAGRRRGDRRPLHGDGASVLWKVNLTMPPVKPAVCSTSW